MRRERKKIRTRRGRECGKKVNEEEEEEEEKE